MLWLEKSLEIACFDAVRSALVSKNSGPAAGRNWNMPLHSCCTCLNQQPPLLPRWTISTSTAIALRTTVLRKLPVWTAKPSPANLTIVILRPQICARQFTAFHQNLPERFKASLPSCRVLFPVSTACQRPNSAPPPGVGRHQLFELGNEKRVGPRANHSQLLAARSGY